MDRMEALSIAHKKAAGGQNVLLYASSHDQATQYSDIFAQFFGIERMTEMSFRVRGNGYVYFVVGEMPEYMRTNG